VQLQIVDSPGTRLQMVSSPYLKSQLTRQMQKGTTRVKRTLSETAGQWQQAIRGNDQARQELFRRIMPARDYRAR